jgi:hypothetical protein
MALTHKNLVGTTQSLLMMKISCKANFSMLSVACHNIYERNEILQCSIKEIDGQLYFTKDVSFSAIPINCSSTPVGEKDLEKIVEDEVNHELEQSANLWRVKMVSAPKENFSWLVLVIHHAIADSEGVRYLGDALLDCLDKLSDGKVLTFSEFKKVHPPIENFLTGHSVNQPSKEVYPKIAYDQNRPLVQRKTKGMVLKLSEAQSILLDCKAMQNNIKTNSIIVSLLCLSINEIQHKNFEFKTAISLRHISKDTTRENFGCYIGVSNFGINNETGESILELARSYENRLIKDIINCLRNNDFSYSAVDTFTRGMANQDNFSQGIGITNLGEINFGNYKNIKVFDYLTISNRNGGNVATVLHVYKFKGSISFNFVYSTPLIDTKKIETISRRFEYLLGEFIGEKIHKESSEILDVEAAF